MKLTNKQMYEILKAKKCTDGCEIILDWDEMLMTYHEWLEYIIETYVQLNEDLLKQNEIDTVIGNIKLISKLNHLNLIDFRDFLYSIGSETTTEQELDRLYDTDVSIIVDGRRIDIEFDATIYNCILETIEKVIKEY